MFHVVTRANRERYSRQLESMYVHRPEMFEGRPAFAAGFLPQGPWFVARGGAPILVDGECVGAIGISGNSGEHEDELARRLAAG